MDIHLVSAMSVSTYMPDALTTFENLLARNRVQSQCHSAYLKQLQETVATNNLIAEEEETIVECLKGALAHGVGEKAMFDYPNTLPNMDRFRRQSITR